MGKIKTIKTTESPAIVHPHYVWRTLFRFLIATILTAMGYGLLRWGVLSFGLFPTVKNAVWDIYIPIGLAFCVAFVPITKTPNAFERLQGLLLLLLFIGNSALFIGVTKFVTRLTVRMEHIDSITPENLERLRLADYITINHLKPDTACVGRYFKETYTTYKSGQRRVHFHHYSVCPLADMRGVFVGKQFVRSQSVAYISKAEMKRIRIDFLTDYAHAVKWAALDAHFFKVLKPADEIENFQAAATFCPAPRGVMPSHKQVFLEITSPDELGKWQDSLWLIFLPLLLEVIFTGIILRRIEVVSMESSSRKGCPRR